MALSLSVSVSDVANVAVVISFLTSIWFIHSSITLKSDDDATSDARRMLGRRQCTVQKGLVDSLLTTSNGGCACFANESLIYGDITLSSMVKNVHKRSTSNILTMSFVTDWHLMLWDAFLRNEGERSDSWPGLTIMQNLVLGCPSSPIL